MRRRRGNVLLVALAFGVLLGFGALAVDVALIRVARSQLQVALDAAALSGASELDGTPAGVDRARRTAVAYALHHAVLGRAVPLAADEVAIGTVDPDRGAFVPWGGGPDASGVDTVRVDPAPTTVSAVLGGVAFGVPSYAVVATSTAVRPWWGEPTRTAECFLPVAVPDCWVPATAGGASPAPFKFTFTPSPSDRIAWADPGKNPDSNGLRDRILGPCAGPEIARDDRLHVNEGSHTSALQAVSDVMNGLVSTPAESWDPALYGPLPPRDGGEATANTPSRSGVSPSRWGRTVEGVVPLIDAGPDCRHLSFTGQKRITGFAWGVIYDVRATGSDKNLYLLVDLANEHRVWGEPDPDASEGNVVSPSWPALAADP